jgi:beta-lactamase class A
VKRSTFLAGGIAGAFALASARLGAAQPSSGTIAAAAKLRHGSMGVFASSLDATDDPIVLRPDEVFPAASTIKLLIAGALMRAAGRDPELLATPVPIRASDIVGGSPALGTALPGRRYSAGTLLRAMIVQSDNTASNALITFLGFEQINAIPADLGLTHTRLARHFTDDPPSWRKSENVTSPRDMGAFLMQLTSGARGDRTELASQEGCRRILRIMLDQEDRAKLPGGIPPGIPVANKTGELERVRNDVAVVDPFGQAPYVVAAFTKNLVYPAHGDAAIRRVSRVIYGALRA